MNQEEEIQEELTALYMFAGIALPGVLGRASMFEDPASIAAKAFEIAEAMVKLSHKKREERMSTINQESNM